VPEALEAGPKTGQQLAAQLKVHRDYLERVLAVAERLKFVGVTHPQPDNPEHKLYHLTQLSAVLCESHPNSVKHMVSKRNR
jgi:DNA-binding HxlR family transcriptional regulator